MTSCGLLGSGNPRPLTQNPDQTTFLVEVDEPTGQGVERTAIDSGELVLKAKQTFEEALGRVQPVASTIISRFRDGLTIPADEVEVKFGLKLSAEAGVIFTSVAGEVNFEITLKWQSK
jgi:hypothetical protein